MGASMKGPRFQLGTVCVSASVNELVSKEGLSFLAQVRQSFFRHHCGDWGCVEDEDKQLNELAIPNSGRLLSAFKLVDSIGTTHKVFIITEADRSNSIMLFASEY